MKQLEREVWEGWTVGDFIAHLESEFYMIMNNQAIHPPFRDGEQLKNWLKDNQPYYKKHIPEVYKYFKTKANL